MLTDIHLPEVSESITSAEVVKVLVAVGQTVSKDDPLLEVETEKALFELPSPETGTISQILVKPGEKVSVGQALLRLETGGNREEERKSGSQEGPSFSPQPSALGPVPKGAGARKSGSEEGLPLETRNSKLGTSLPQRPASDPQLLTPSSSLLTAPVASPSVRKLARELGVDVAAVRGSGERGRISKEDVKAFAKAALGRGSLGAAASSRPLPDFAKWGPVRREPASKVRKITAESMAFSWATVPQVTQFDRADLTELESFREKQAKVVAPGEAKITLTAVLLKVAAAALRKYPRFNASLDAEHGEILFREYVNVGVAVDTERGLLVPVVKDADRKSVGQLAGEVALLAEKARSKKLLPDELEGGGFTVSNLGGIGGTGFSPIVYWPQSAILGVSRSEPVPVWKGGQFVPRLLLPLSLTYDHRLIDGADGARFLRWVCEALEEPWLLVL